MLKFSTTLCLFITVFSLFVHYNLVKMSVEIQNYLIPYICTNKQPYNVFRGFWGEYRSFWSGISDRIGPGLQSVSDQFPKIWYGSGRTGNCWSFSTLRHHFALFFIPLPLPNCHFSYARALAPIPLSLCS